MVKRNFRALRAKKLTGQIQDSHDRLVTKAVQQLKKQDIRSCVDHVAKLLK